MSDSLTGQQAERAWGRMLLSHNFNLSPDYAPVLSREEFAQVFIVGMGDDERCKIRFIEHPHWIVEVLFAAESLTPQQVGTLCAGILAKSRGLASAEHVSPTQSPFEVLVLGGVKTTPATSDAPDALQPGNWGVDVVETPSGETFLQSLNWDAMVSQKSEDQTFVVKVSL